MVLLTTPRKPSSGDGWHRFANEVEHRDAVHHRALEQKPTHRCCAASSGEPRIGERCWSLVGRHDVAASLPALSSRDPGPAAQLDNVERCRFDEARVAAPNFAPGRR